MTKGLNIACMRVSNVFCSHYQSPDLRWHFGLINLLMIAMGSGNVIIFHIYSHSKLVPPNEPLLIAKICCADLLKMCV